MFSLEGLIIDNQLGQTAILIAHLKFTSSNL